MFGPFSGYVRPYRTRMALGVAAIALSQVAAAYIPLLLAEAVNSLDASARGHDELLIGVGGHIVWILGLGLIVAAGGYAMRRLMGTASTRIEYDIRRAYFAHLIAMPLSFFQSHRTGDLMARATNDLRAVSIFFTYGFRSLVEAVLIFAFSFAMMCGIDWQLALTVLLPLPLLGLFTVRMASIVHARFRAIQECFGEISNFIQENLAGIRVVKSFVLRRAQTAGFDRLNGEYLAHNYRYIRTRAIYRPLSFTIGSLGLGLNLWFGGKALMRGQITIGEFVAFNAYLTLLIRPIAYSGWVVDRLQRALVAIRRIDEVLAIRPQLAGARNSPATGAATASQRRSAPIVSGNISFRNVCFAYGDGPVLSDIDLDIPAGSTLGVVGRVGSGKTTLVRLVPHLIDPASGQVAIDGLSVGEWPPHTLRQAIGYVSQSPFLFSASIRANIAYGVESYTDMEVASAARQAQLDGDIAKLHRGFETLVGERGVTLSGGQKQRCTLARALMCNPRILILDDALSAVDTETEQAVLDHLRDAMRGRTTLIVAHRLSTLRHADLIVVIDEGRIVERGDHAALLAMRGLYAELYERQRLTAELESL